MSEGDPIIAILTEELVIAHAQRDALRRALGNLIAYVQRVGGFMTPQDQAVLRHAIAAYVEGKS